MERLVNILDTFGKRLRKLRREKDWSQEELANRLDSHKATISNWEKDKRFPDDHNIIIKLADLFDCSTDYLMCRRDYKNARLISAEELKTFLPSNFVDKHKLEIEVDDPEGSISDETMNEIKEVLRKAGHLK